MQYFMYQANIFKSNISVKICKRGMKHVQMSRYFCVLVGMRCFIETKFCDLCVKANEASVFLLLQSCIHKNALTYM